MEYIYSFESSNFYDLSEPPMAHVSASIGHKIFLIGGYRISYENDTRTIIAFDKHSLLYFDILNSKLNTMEFSYDLESIGSFPMEFFCASGIACCSFDNRIYLFGGYSLSKQEAGNALYYIELTKETDPKSINRLDIESAATRKPTARLVFLAGSHDQSPEEQHRHNPSYRDKASIVFWRHQLFVFGGYGSNYHRTMAHETDQGHEFMADSGEYVSGSGNRGWTNQTLVFCLATGHWSNPATGGRVPGPRAAHSAAVTEDGRMLVFGGRLGIRDSSATVRSNQLFCLDLRSLQWTELTLFDRPDVTGRSWTTLTRVTPCCLFVLGGFSGDNAPLSDAFCLSISDVKSGATVRSVAGFQRADWSPRMDQSSWSVPVSDLQRQQPVKRMWHSAALAPDGFLYAIGGCRNNLIYQVERIQTRMERVRPAPLSLYRLCLWAVFTAKLSIDRLTIPDRLFADLAYLTL